ncbi:hypothetical protein DL95DRAFT_362868 [Leptodontidium sp. 2 PMI_412]|nr:hypothetical protein DL95DRAFT_362868 [Leptodontidium sp. 2 PMI_412]
MENVYFHSKHPSDEQLSEAAAFFSANYGVWGQSAVENMGPSMKIARVKISPKLLRKKILPDGGNNTFISTARGNELLGILFATRWMYKGKSILWVTQLCVHLEYRNEGIAKGLLSALNTNEDYAIGILSSHPFSISAVARVFGNGLEDVDLYTMRLEARDIMATCPVTYVRDAKLRGSLFEHEPEDGTLSCADTQFWVDHREPDEALNLIKEKGRLWPFGHLPEGHEYLLLVKLKRVAAP